MGGCRYSALGTLCACPQLYLRKASISRQTLAGGASSPAEATVDQLFLFKRDSNLSHWVQPLSLKEDSVGKKSVREGTQVIEGQGNLRISPQSLSGHLPSQILTGQRFVFPFPLLGRGFFYFIFLSISCILWHDWRCSWTSEPVFTSEVLLSQVCTDMSSLLAAGKQTQVFVHATQMFYQQSYTSNLKEI